MLDVSLFIRTSCLVKSSGNSAFLLTKICKELKRLQIRIRQNKHLESENNYIQLYQSYSGQITLLINIGEYTIMNCMQSQVIVHKLSF